MFILFQCGGLAKIDGQWTNHPPYGRIQRELRDPKLRAARLREDAEARRELRQRVVDAAREFVPALAAEPSIPQRQKAGLLHDLAEFFGALKQLSP